MLLTVIYMLLLIWCTAFVAIAVHYGTYLLLLLRHNVYLLLLQSVLLPGRVGEPCRAQGGKAGAQCDTWRDRQGPQAQQ
jgi:hypothetical protein